MIKPRRGLPADDDQFRFEETELEISAIRRGMLLDDDNEVATPRRASRAAAGEDAPEAVEVDLQPKHRPSRAAADAPSDAPSDVEHPAKPEESAKPAVATASGATAASRKAAASTRPKSRAATDAKPKPSTSKDRDPAGPRSRRLLMVAAAGALALATGLAIGMVPAEEPPLPATVPLVTAISRTCPSADGVASTLAVASSEGDIQLRAVGQPEPITRQGPTQLPGQTIPVVITPTLPQASVTGGSLINEDGNLWWGTCRAALADQYVQLPGGGGAKLLITNPEPQAALIDITLTGPGGEITAEGLRGLTIEADSQEIIDLAEHAGDVNAVGARVRSSVGRVHLAAQLAGGDGADFATSTVQSPVVTIAAVPADAERTVLLLTNPGTNRNVVQIEGISEAGRYTLDGYESYPLDAQRTVAVDVTDAIDGAPVGLIITGRDEFAASAVITQHDDFAMEPGQSEEQTASAVDLVSVIGGSGVLQIANPGEGEAFVTIDWGADQAEANRTIGPGSVAAIEIPAGAQIVRLQSVTPITAALLLRPAEGDGFSIAVLHQAARSRASMPMEIEPGLGR